MNTEQKQIDTHTYPENATPLELARYEVAVREAAENGAIVTTDAGGPLGIPAAIKGTSSTWFHSLKYRVARPKIAEGHNPDGLTEDQVGVKDGWRLLSAEEREARAQSPSITHGIDRWSKQHGCWSVNAVGNWTDMTYRTKAAPGAYLPKPAPVKTLRAWTFTSVPKCHLLLRDKTEVKRIYVASFFDENGITSGYHREWSVLLSAFEHSTDNAATWHPCGTYAEGQP